MKGYKALITLNILCEKKCSKLGITYKMDDIISEYKSRFESEQISFDL